MVSATKNLTEPRIWSSVIRGLRLPLIEHGVNFDELLMSCDIAPEDIERVHAKVPLKKYLRLMESAAASTGDPLLGIRMARSCGPETLGAVGFLFLSSRSLAEAITDFCAYLNVLQDTTDFRATQDRDDLSFNYQMFGIPEVDCRQDVEFSLALTLRLIRMYGGRNVEISNVSFRHSPSVPIQEYERLLKAEPLFNQESNCVTIPSSAGRVSGHSLDPGLAPILKDFLDADLAARGRIRSFVDQVRQVLIGNRIPAPVTAEKTAHYIGMSVATLHRRLRDERTTFRRLRDNVNFELARNYLADSALSITQIAYVVGFSESASFTRAFRRWSGGTSPSEFRKSNHTAIEPS